jgi:hypothetical protein
MKMPGWAEWALNRTPFVSNAYGLIKGDPRQATLGSMNFWKSDINKAGQMTGLASTPSEQEKENLEQQRALRDQMLAALKDRIANPLQAPQLGGASWMGYQTPAGPGTTNAPIPYRPVPTGTTGLSKAPVPSGFAGPSAPVAAQSSPMVEELERIRRQRLLTALENASGIGGLKLG